MDITQAVQSDMVPQSFQSDLFLKVEEDREQCSLMIENNFDKLKLVQIENLAQSFFTTYPEVSFIEFLKYMTS